MIPAFPTTRPHDACQRLLIGLEERRQYAKAQRDRALVEAQRQRVNSQYQQDKFILHSYEDLMK